MRGFRSVTAKKYSFSAPVERIDIARICREVPGGKRHPIVEIQVPGHQAITLIKSATIQWINSRLGAGILSSTFSLPDYLRECSASPNLPGDWRYVPCTLKEAQQLRTEAFLVEKANVCVDVTVS